MATETKDTAAQVVAPETATEGQASALTARAEQALLSLPEPGEAIRSSTDGYAWLEEPLVLSVTDLLPDAGGEVIFEDVGGGPVVFAGAMVAESGLAESGHATSDGVDVSGLAYARLDNGITLFYDPTAEIAFQEG